MCDIHTFESSYKRGSRPCRRRVEQQDYEQNYLKPPTLRIYRQDSSGSERSDDSSLSFLSSSSCSLMSGGDLSDLCEEN